MLDGRGLTRDVRARTTARLGVELLGEHGDLTAPTRAEWTDPRKNRAIPMELHYALPLEIVHVRRPIRPDEEAKLPEWFNTCEPFDQAGEGTPIAL